MNGNQVYIYSSMPIPEVYAELGNPNEIETYEGSTLLKYCTRQESPIKVTYVWAKNGMVFRSVTLTENDASSCELALKPADWKNTMRLNSIVLGD